MGFGIGPIPFPGLLYFLDGIGTGLEKNLVPEKFPELVSEKLSTEKSLGTGLGENLVPKKVSEPVSKNFCTAKSLGIGLEKIWYRKNVPEPVSVRFLVSSHTAKRATESQR